MKLRTPRGQRVGLTKAMNAPEGERLSRIEYECRRVVGFDWTDKNPHTPYWPDNWRKWLRALEDAGARPDVVDEIFWGQR